MVMLELILLLAAAVLVSSVIDQLVPRVSLPLIQIALGVGIAILAWSPIDVTLEPELFLVLFIAPILFHDAKNSDKLALWKNRGFILSLAIGLVVVLALIVGFSVNALIPSIPLAAAFALGAALGPTDAVAVGALSSVAQLKRREDALLSGEALLNDASGVVTFQFAIAAAITGAFSLVDASLSFLISFIGGIVGGILLGIAAHWLQNKIRDLGLESITFHVLFDVFLPFIIYLTAEIVHVSGILAVVAAGIVISSYSERKIGPAASRLNIVSSSVWRVLTFTLNGVVFVMLGMQLPRAMQSSWDDIYINNFFLIGAILLISAILVLVRFAWLIGMEWFTRKKESGGKTRLDRDTIRSSLVATIGGPKGAVTLSIIFSIPFFMADGSAFPQRNLIIFLASGVILVTLLLANFLLPILAPSTEIETDAEGITEIRIETLRRVIEKLSAIKNLSNAQAVNAVISSYNERIESLKDMADINSNEPLYRLRLDVVHLQEHYLIQMVDSNQVDEALAIIYFSQLNRAEEYLTHALGQKKERFEGLQTLKRLMRNAKKIIIDAIPGVSETKRAEERRDMKIACEKHALFYLEDLVERLNVNNSDTQPYPVEVVTRVLQQHQVALRALEAERPSFSVIARTSDNIEDIERRALNMELDEIQDLYDEGKINHAQIKEMRESVYLMQIDLEDHV